MTDQKDVHILIVDDRRDDVELMTATLEQARPGCRITAAHSAEEAQAKIGDEAWTLILLDYKLPRQTGLELLPKLVRAAPTAATIMLTGHGDERVAVEAMRKGAAYYLKKSSSLLTELPLVVNEVLEKWRLRQELDLAHSRLHSLINHVTDIIYELDAEGRLSFVSREVEWSLGYSPGELLGRHFSDLLQPEAAQRAGRMVAERRTGARATRGLEVSLTFKRGLDVHLQTRGGEVRLFEVNAAGLYDSQRNFLGTAGVARDITKRKQDEVARREFESRLQAVLDLASDAIYMKSRDGRYLLVNPAARRLLSRADTEALGKTDAELLDEATAKEFMRTDRDVLVAGQRVECLEKEFLPDGSVRIWSTIKTPHRGPDDQILGLFGISRDVTEQLRREEAQHHAEKLKALGQLVAGVAHELNNPLTTILGHAHLLQQHAHADPECLAAAEIIVGQAERTATIVRDLLTVARPQAPIRIPVSVNSLIELELRSLADDLAAHAVAVTLELDPACPQIFADAVQVQQVLGTLFSNAVQAMHAAHGNGTLTVTTALVTDAETGGCGDAEIAASSTHRVSASGSVQHWVEIRVTDDGPGIPPEHRARIFEPFFTTKPVGKGTGLGLAIAHSIITEHGGAITGAQVPGGGAQFIVRVPAHAPGALSMVVPATPPPVSSRKARILILEDEAMIRNMMTRVLSRAGHEVLLFEDGHQALAYLTKPDNAVDVILSDIKMPGLSGGEFFSRLHGSVPALAERVIFCTGNTLEETTANLIDASGNLSLPKPFRPQRLLEVVTAVLHRVMPEERRP